MKHLEKNHDFIEQFESSRIKGKVYCGAIFSLVSSLQGESTQGTSQPSPLSGAGLLSPFFEPLLTGPAGVLGKEESASGQQDGVLVAQIQLVHMQGL